MNYKICITAAGIGSRLEELTKYYNKSLITINNKPAISHIIESFSRKITFVIAVGYLGEQVRSYLKIAHPNYKFEFVKVPKYRGKGSGLGYSLLCCRNKLNLPFIYISCDTLFEGKVKKPDHNWMGFSKGKNISQYRSLKIHRKKVISIFEKGEKYKDLKTYIGMSGIYDFKKFWKSMIQGKNISLIQGEVYGMQNLIKNKIKAYDFKWHDIGNTKSLHKTRKLLRKKKSLNILEKKNEALWLVNNEVIKYSTDKQFIKNRIKRAKLLDKFTPKIIASNSHMYKYKKVEGQIMSEILDFKIFDHFLSHSEKFWKIKKINKLQKNKFQKYCYNFYKIKTINRTKLFFKKFELKDNIQIINGKKIPKIFDLYDSIDWKWLSKGIPSRFHGDYHFENILFLGNKKFIFLDWRQNFEKLLDYGDIYYDFAKLLHGMIVSHKIINDNLFRINWNNKAISFDINRKYYLVEIEKKFIHWLEINQYDILKVRILTALIFINISPLHHDLYSRFLFSLGKYMLSEEINNA